MGALVNGKGVTDMNSQAMKIITTKEAGMAEDYSKSGAEPPVNELVDDPIIRLIMKSDGVTLGALLPLIEEASDKVQKQRKAA